MNFFNFGSSKDPDPDLAQDENDILSLNSDVRQSHVEAGKGNQLEVNSQVSSVVRLDNDSDGAESISFQIPNPNTNISMKSTSKMPNKVSS